MNHMRNRKLYLEPWLLACALGVACAAGKGGKNVGDERDGRAGNNGSAGLNISVGAAGTSGAGGTSSTVTEEPVYDCNQNEDCCPQDPTCTSAEQYVCTTVGKCGKVKGSCSSPDDCQSDTYCCDATCRKDGAMAAVCLPNNVPPGIACSGGVPVVGQFSPALQCSWKAEAGDANGSFVLASPLVADLPNDSGAAAEIVFATFSTADGDGSVSTPGTLRIISGQDCHLLETVADSSKLVRAAAAPALADLDGDGNVEIVARRNSNGLIAFTWDGSKYVKLWQADGPDLSAGHPQAWDGPSVHDLNGDGQPEIVLWDTVYDAQGKQLFAGSIAAYFGYNGYIPVLGDFDADGKVEIVKPYGINGINYAEWTGSDWKNERSSNNGPWFGPQNVQFTHFAVADFGASSAGSFTPGQLDGQAELVAVAAECENASCGGGRVSVFSLDGSEVLSVATLVDPQVAFPPPQGNESGGPPTIGNLDGDATPEFAIAGATRLRAFDFDCQGAGNGCEAKYVKWSQPSQDASSRQTGASIFDFEGDGKAEVVYGDECFTRVYSGETGEVLFSSYRTSATWFEGPVIADVDRDQNTEIVVGSAYGLDCPTNATPGGSRNEPYVDPLDPGVRCDSAEGCLPGSSCAAGFCRCSGGEQCCAAGQTLEQCGLSCAASLRGGSNVCRATHPNSESSDGGVRVLRDRLDRWASSRSIWNQHAYSISNVGDDGKVPATPSWTPNWTIAEPGYNSFRQNVQGSTGAGDLPDITGRFTDDEPCVTGGESGRIYLQATVCNRGKRAVGAALPGTFYVGDPAQNQVLCTSYTDGPVPTGGCKLVFCEVSPERANELVGEEINLVVNRDQSGAAATVECRPDNNRSTTKITNCKTQVPR